MRIIAGKYKNRVIPTNKKSDYRPSTTKFREALFSILSSGEFASSMPVEGADILDLFAGTGALSFEALSRGASSATLIDNKSDHLKYAVEFAKKIGADEQINALATSAINLPTATTQYSLVFMDPPYYNKYVEKSLKSLHAQGWLKNGAIVAAEMSKHDDVKLPDGFSLIKEKLYGNNKLLIIEYEQE